MGGRYVLVSLPNFDAGRCSGLRQAAKRPDQSTHRAVTGIMVLLYWIAAVISPTHADICLPLHLDQSLLAATRRFHTDPHHYINRL